MDEHDLASNTSSGGSTRAIAGRPFSGLMRRFLAHWSTRAQYKTIADGMRPIQVDGVNAPSRSTLLHSNNGSCSRAGWYARPEVGLEPAARNDYRLRAAHAVGSLRNLRQLDSDRRPADHDTINQVVNVLRVARECF